MAAALGAGLIAATGCGGGGGGGAGTGVTSGSGSSSTHDPLYVADAGLKRAEGICAAAQRELSARAIAALQRRGPRTSSTAAVEEAFTHTLEAAAVEAIGVLDATTTKIQTAGLPQSDAGFYVSVIGKLSAHRAGLVQLGEELHARRVVSVTGGWLPIFFARDRACFEPKGSGG